MKVIITGSGGQLGRELKHTAPDRVQLFLLDLPDFDLTDLKAVQQTVKAVKPDWIINTAAYTAVDRAESEPELARAVNRDGAFYLARVAAEIRSRLVQISTDFVFDGQQGRPYRPEDRPNPQGAYAASKLAGERAVLEVMGEKALIIRTAWLYSAHGHNFVKTILRLIRERDHLQVVDDQLGTPTWARGLARAVWKAVALDLTGIHHWTDAGVAGWYDFAVAIQEEALALKLVPRAIPILPVTSEDYPLPAPRPRFSVLDKTETWRLLGGPADHWRTALRRMLGDMKNG